MVYRVWADNDLTKKPFLVEKGFILYKYYFLIIFHAFVALYKKVFWKKRLIMQFLCKIGLNRDYISTVIVHKVKLAKLPQHLLYYLEKRGKENEMQYCLSCNFA